MIICEEFDTIQGEGQYVGKPSHFIRTTGCNLRCIWKNSDGSYTKCDTPYTSWNPEKGKELDVAKTIKHLEQSNIQHVVLTGGEPTMQSDIVDVVNILSEHGYMITIETNGTYFYESMTWKNVLLSISPKLQSSFPDDNFPTERKLHTKNNHWENTVQQWMSTHAYQLKFVVNEEKDIHEILKYQKKLMFPFSNVYLMPQGITTEQFNDKAKMIFDKCVQYGFNYSPRLHIDIFGNIRGI